MPTSLIFTVLFLAQSLFFLTCAAPKGSTQAPAEQSNTLTDGLPYDLTAPSLTIALESKDLKEISGLSPSDRPGVFCAVQDEKGIIFLIDGAKGGSILQQIPFKDKGDFEGVEMVGNTIYALESKGKIFALTNWENGQVEMKDYKTPLSKADDVEGLGYDKQRNALLLACKGNPDSANMRQVYAFDLGTKRLSEKPVFSIDPLEVLRLIPNDPDSKPDHFSPSGIAVHPKTQDVYVISSAKKRLVVLDYNTGKIKYATKLKKSILPQPEGIAFDAKGNLYLSSEGKNGEGLLYMFEQK